MRLRLKDYGRNQKKRKEFVQQSGLLIIGVDVSRLKHDACIGTIDTIISRITFTNTRDGFKRFEEAGWTSQKGSLLTGCCPYFSSSPIWCKLPGASSLGCLSINGFYPI